MRLFHIGSVTLLLLRTNCFHDRWRFKKKQKNTHIEITEYDHPARLGCRLLPLYLTVKLLLSLGLRLTPTTSSCCSISYDKHWTGKKKKKKSTRCFKLWRVFHTADPFHSSAYEWQAFSIFPRVTAVKCSSPVESDSAWIAPLETINAHNCWGGGGGILLIAYVSNEHVNYQQILIHNFLKITF